MVNNDESTGSTGYLARDPETTVTVYFDFVNGCLLFWIKELQG